MSTTKTAPEASWTSRIPAGGGARVNNSLPQRERPSRGRMLIALLLVIGAALAVALVVMKAGGKVEVVAVSQDVAKGEVIERADLSAASVAGVAGAIAVEDVAQVVGKTAAVDLVAGQVILEQQLTSEAVPGDGDSLVGLSLEPARIPAGLQPGDLVNVIAVPAADSTSTGKAGSSENTELEAPRVLAEAATVYSARGEGTAGGAQLLTVVVKESDAARLAAYSTSNRVAVVEISAQGD